MADVLRQLQSRIDRKGWEIADAIAMGYWNDIGKEQQKNIMAKQALDKRLYGKLVQHEKLIAGYKKLLLKYSRLVQENVRLHGFETVKPGDIISEKI